MKRLRATRLVGRRGFTLVEVLIATALLGFSLVVMFGFHVQAVRSNKYARKLTDCTYLAQQQMEQLHAIEWTSGAGRGGTDLDDGASGATAYLPLYHPASGATPTLINAAGEAEGSETQYQPVATYAVTWEITALDATDDTWIQMHVRCSWDDSRFNTTHGTTVSDYRFRDQ